MKAYSQDLRERIVGAVEQGMLKAEAARTFQVALSTVKLYLARLQQTGSLAAGRSSGRPRAIPRAADPLLERQLRAHPDYTVAQHAALWEQEQHTAVGRAALRRAIHRLGWHFKKRRWWPPRAMPRGGSSGTATPDTSMPTTSSSSTKPRRRLP
jgi:transposase